MASFPPTRGGGTFSAGSCGVLYATGRSLGWTGRSCTGWRPPWFGSSLPPTPIWEGAPPTSTRSPCTRRSVFSRRSTQGSGWWKRSSREAGKRASRSSRDPSRSSCTTRSGSRSTSPRTCAGSVTCRSTPRGSRPRWRGSARSPARRGKGGGGGVPGGAAAELARKGVSVEFVGYDRLEAGARVVALFRDGKRIMSAVEGEEVDFVTDVTPFYGEAGGQVGEVGGGRGGAFRLGITDARRP